MNRRRLIGTAVTAAMLVGAALTLRSGVQPPPPAAVGPDGARIAAYHDPKLVDPPQRPQDRPRQPGRLHTDERRGGVLLSWPAAPYGFEVRWGLVGQPLREVRYVATPATGLDRLQPGRYRVEVRSVDEVGRRSEPSATEVEVSRQPPSWQQGLPFLEDFTTGAALDPDRWLIPHITRQCLRRERELGPLLVSGHCLGLLSPSSPLVLSDPDSSGVRGRLLVLADAPAAPGPASADPPADGGDGLVIVVGPSLFAATQTVTLRVHSRGAFLAAGGSDPNVDRAERKLDAAAVGNPGVLQRWELVFTTDEVRVLRDGQPVGGLPYRPPWQQATVGITAQNFGEDEFAAGTRIGLVGLTGPAPDGLPSQLLPLDGSATSPQPKPEHRFTIGAVPTAMAARVSGIVVGEIHPDGARLPAPDLLVEFAGRTLRPDRTVTNEPEGFSYWLQAQLPAAGLAAGAELVLRSRDGSNFLAFEVTMDITHRAGTQLPTPPTLLAPRQQPSLARPQLIVRNGSQSLQNGEKLPRGQLQVEIRPGSQVVSNGTLVGWVAVRVELDGRRILDYPTTTDGPAFASSYRFTLRTTDLPAGDLALVVSLIPDRPGVSAAAVHFSVRL